MMSISDFAGQIFGNRVLDVYTLLVQAMSERGASAENIEDFRLAGAGNIRFLIERLYGNLTSLARRFLVDPAEVTLENLLANRIRCYDLPLLAQRSGRSFVVPVTTAWRDKGDLVVGEYRWPYRSMAVATTRYKRPRLLHRFCGEYFLQAAEMLKHLRYYAPDAFGSFIDIPACAAGASRSHINLIRVNAPHLKDATDFQIQQVWNGYLAPGRYRMEFFGEATSDEFPLAFLAGYVDLNDNLQFFTQ